MTTVLLIRHGRTTANATGVLAGWTPGITLDDRGREQARALADRLADVPVSTAVVSPLERTQETADIILAGRDAVARHLDDRVGECHYGAWTGLPLKQLARDPLWKVVQSHPSAAVFPEGESLPAMQHRAVSCVREWNRALGPNSVYAVVSHGDVIKAILADALGLHLDHFQRISVDPCSLSVVRYTDQRPFVERMNDTGGGLTGLIPSKGSRSRRRSDAVVGGGAGA